MTWNPISWLSKGTEFLWGLFTSVKWAVFYVAFLAVLCIYGTTLPEQQALQYFQSTGFNVFVVILMVNLIVVVADRYPWKLHHVGFILVHFGLVITLIGAVVTNRYGIEGTIQLREGSSTNRMMTDQRYVLVEFPENDFRSRVWINHEEEKTGSLDYVYDLGEKIQLRIDRLAGSLSREEEVVAATSGPLNPAVGVQLQTPRGQLSEMLLAREAGRHAFEVSVSQTERLGVYYILFPDREALEQACEQGEPAPPILTFETGEEGGPVEFPIDPDKEKGQKPVTVGPYRIRVLAYYNDFAIRQGRPVNRSDSPRNPAVRLEIDGPEGVHHRWVFASNAIPAMHGQDPYENLTAELRGPTGGAGLPDGALHILGTRKAVASHVFVHPPGGPGRLVPLSPGKEIVAPWADSRLSVGTVMARAKRVVRHVDDPNGPPNPAFHVILERGEKKAEAWLPFGIEREVVFDGWPVRLSYRPREVPIEFNLKLEDFILETYEGSSRPASFESDVRVQDVVLEQERKDGTTGVQIRARMKEEGEPPAGLAAYLYDDAGEVQAGFRADGLLSDKGAAKSVEPGSYRLFVAGFTDNPMEAGRVEVVDGERTDVQLALIDRPIKISMNQPLFHRGRTFFQMSYDQQTLKTSVFSVNYDPGYKIVYFGFFVLTLGVIYIFYLTPYFRERLKEKMREKGLRALEEHEAKAREEEEAAAVEADDG